MLYLLRNHKLSDIIDSKNPFIYASLNSISDGFNNENDIIITFKNIIRNFNNVVINVSRLEAYKIQSLVNYAKTFHTDITYHEIVNSEMDKFEIKRCKTKTKIE